MHHFDYQDGRLYCEQVPLERIVEAVGTPVYVYSDATIRRHFEVFDNALRDVRHLVCYSVKSNSNAAVLATLAAMGAGADVVSGGELQRALAAGIPAERIVFSGVGKRADEIALALDKQILMFNVESASELELISSIAAARGKNRADCPARQSRCRSWNAPLYRHGFAQKQVRHCAAPRVGRLSARAGAAWATGSRRRLPYWIAADHRGAVHRVGQPCDRDGPEAEVARSAA